MEILNKALQLILCLSILVVLHEFGHFLPARLFKTRIEKFFLFFDAWKFKFFSFKKGDTEYGIGWLPLGGYVKIAGMVDESMDVKQLEQIPQPWEFRSKPAWQRLIVMIGGVTMNALLGIFLFSMILFYYGEESLLNKDLKYGIVALEIGEKLGLKNGDKILKVNGEEIDKFEEVLKKPLINSNSSYTIQRGDSIFEFPLPKNLGDLLVENDSLGFITFAFNFKVGQLAPGGNAEKAGILPEDEITGINNKPIFLFHEFRKELNHNKNQTITVELMRKGEKESIDVLVDSSGKIGFAPISLLETHPKQYSVFESFNKGTVMAFTVLSDQYKGLKKLIRGETKAKNSLGSFIRIGSYFESNWNWKRFWYLTAVLSMVLAMMNLLPIPALDGGHILFIIPEFITGKKPSDKFMEKAQYVGMTILIALMLYAVFNDVVWAFFS